MKKIFLLFQMFLVAFAEPLDDAIHRPVVTQDYLQELLKSELEGEELLKAYDVHYNSMSPSNQLAEKLNYPDNVYADLHAHRKSLFKF